MYRPECLNQFPQGLADSLMEMALERTGIAKERLASLSGDFDLVFTHVKGENEYSISRLELKDAVGGFDSVEGLSLAKEFLQGQEESL